MIEPEMPNPEELEEIRGKKFTKLVALVTAIFAVALAVTSLGGNNAMKEMLLAQQQASDQWAFYQAKAIREHLYKSQRIMLENQRAAALETLSVDAAARIDATLKSLSDEESRYKLEKKEIEAEAKRLERERDVNRSKDPYFDYAEVLLQIAIVMASVSIISASHGIFYFAASAAVIGTLLAINGFLLLFSIPFLH